MTKLELVDLGKAYAKSVKPALDGVSLTVEPGERLALLGPSGCGKTTALKIIAGLIEPDRGDVRVDGASVQNIRPERRSLSMMFQQPLLFPFMSVAQNVGFGLRMRKLAASDVSKRTSEMLARVKLDGFGERKPAELSGGQQQRVALARALVVEPKVLLLDEPLSDLDSNLRGDMQDLLLDLQSQTSVTTLLVTHDQAEAVKLSHRIALMLEGRIHQVGTPEELYAKPADLEVARFFGGRNFLAGRISSGSFDSAFGKLALEGSHPDGPATLTIRPESIVSGATAVNSFPATIREKRFLGAEVRLSLDVGGIGVEMSGPPDAMRDLRPGDVIQISFPPRSLWVFRS